jgi:hypothetical protein
MGLGDIGVRSVRWSARRRLLTWRRGRRPYQGRCFVDKQALDGCGFDNPGRQPVDRTGPLVRAPAFMHAIHD